MQAEATIGDMIEIMLAMTFLYFSYTATMPSVSYIKAADVFLGACFLFVFLAFIKMGVQKMKIRRRRRRFSKRITQAGSPDADDEKAKDVAKQVAFLETGDDRPVDRWHIMTDTKAALLAIFSNKGRTFLIFPIAFAIFAAVYFLVYLIVVKDQSQKRCNF